MMYRVLKLPKSSFYQAAHKKPSVYEVEKEKLLKRICEIHSESHGRYEAPKIHHLLCKEGYIISIKRVQHLIKQAGVRSTIVKKYRPASSQGLVKNVKIF